MKEVSRDGSTAPAATTTLPTDDEPPDSIVTPVTFPVVDPSRYALGPEIGRGGVGRLLAAEDRRLRRPVAIKVLRRLDARAERRFLREAAVTARLEHPGIVAVHDFGRWPTGEPFYAMRRVSGRTLHDVVTERTSLAARLPLLPRVQAALEAVAYAHGRGVLHRDLTPANVLLGGFGETVVIDWGLARPLDDLGDDDGHGDDEAAAGADSPDAATAVTARGAVLGTPAFMAPEQARGARADERTDVYAAGALLYFVVTRRAPHEGETTAAVLRSAAERDPAPMETLEPEVPEELAAIVRRAMQREPAARYPSAASLAADLARFLDGRLVEAHAYSPLGLLRRWARRHRALVAVLGLSLVTVVVVAGSSVQRVLAARRDAERLGGIAEVARRQAERERDALVLAQAEAVLERDPTLAFAWLRRAAERPEPDWTRIEGLARRALSLGVARVRVRATPPLAIDPSGEHLIAAAPDGLRVHSLVDGTPGALLPLAARARAVAYAGPAGDVVVADDDGRVSRLGVADGAVRWTASVACAARSLAVRPEDGRVAIGCDRGRVVVLAADGRVVRELKQGTADLQRVQWSGAADRILAETMDAAPRVWDPATGEALDLPETPLAKAVAASTDGTAWAWGTGRGQVHLVAAGSPLRTLGIVPPSVQRVAFAPTGDAIALACGDGTVRVWSLDGREESVFRGHRDVVTGVHFSPDGRTVVSTGIDRVVRTWDRGTHDGRVLRGHDARIAAVVFAGGRIVTADEAGEVRVWGEGEATPRALGGHEGSEGAYVRYARDGALLTCGDVGGARRWAPGADQPTVLATSDGGGACAVAADGRVAFSGGDGVILVFDPAGTPLQRLVGHEGLVYRLAFAPDGGRLASGGEDHTVRVWDLVTGAGRALGRHEGAVWHVAFDPRGSWVASAGDDLPLRIWPVAEGEPRKLEGPEGLTYDLRFAPDGTLLSAGSDAAVRAWSLADGSVRVHRGHLARVWQLAIAPDGASFASVGDDRRLRVWPLTPNADGPDLVREHAAGLFTVAYSPDGGRVAVGAGDGSISVWDARTGALRQTMRADESPLNDLAFAPDGRTLAVASGDGRIRVWTVDVETERATRGWLDAHSRVALDPSAGTSP